MAGDGISSIASGITGATVKAKCLEALASSEGKASILDAVIDSIVQSVFKWDAVENSHIVLVGTWATDDSSDYWLGRLVQCTSGNQNDAIGVGSFVITEETDYKVIMTFVKDADYGKAHFLLNGVDKGNIDCYNASETFNNLAEVTLGNLPVGLYNLGIDMASKTGSNHRAGIMSLSIVKE